MTGFEGNTEGVKGYNGAAGAFMAMNNVNVERAPEDQGNRLDNKHLPGGLFTHPGVLS